MIPAAPEAEWLEADGLGGFASGTVAGARTRRYHAWLLSAEPDGSRFVLVNGADVTVTTPAGAWSLSLQRYAGGPPAGAHPWLESFSAGSGDIDKTGAPPPWPRWIFALPDGTRIEQQLFARHGHPQTYVSWRLLTPGGTSTQLRVRPFLSGRDYHALHHENPAFRWQADLEDAGAGGQEKTRPQVRCQFWPYPGVPGIVVAGNGRYRPDPHWYRGFHYAEEAARGLDSDEDLAAPGELEFDLGAGEAALILARRGQGADAQDTLAPGAADTLLRQVRQVELERRLALGSPLQRAADAYVIARDGGKTIIAGYPWFTDWGRDTFIALRGICLATGRFDDARAILLRWSGTVSQGMLPNRFPDRGAAPEYNSVDAALWYAVVVYEYLQAAQGRAQPSAAERAQLVAAVEQILLGHAAGTRYGIAVSADGLLAAGEPGVQLTWMDAKIGDWVVTPRIGKPVEIQALWLNALWAAAALGTPSAPRWRVLLAQGRDSFAARFWNPALGHLNDVVDVNHQAGRVDAQLRPNQILAVGGLPLALLEGPRACAVVDAVEAQLWTTLGLRSLAPADPSYCARYAGGMRERDGAYHQGTVWPWLLGPFVEAWVNVRGGSAAAAREARTRFLQPLYAHLGEAGVGHISEVADAESPHRPGGAPFQAWSVGELLRLELLVLGDKAGMAGAGAAAGAIKPPAGLPAP